MRRTSPFHTKLANLAGAVFKGETLMPEDLFYRTDLRELERSWVKFLNSPAGKAPIG
jgi:hypothetical protein